MILPIYMGLGKSRDPTFFALEESRSQSAAAWNTRSARKSASSFEAAGSRGAASDLGRYDRYCGRGSIDPVQDAGGEESDVTVEVAS